MRLGSRGHRRACDQAAVVKKRDSLVCDRDDDQKRALRSILGPNALRRSSVCLPVMVLVFERSGLAWPGREPKLSVRGPYREHQDGEYRDGYRADESIVDASGDGCRHGARMALVKRFLCAPHRWSFLCGHRPIPPARFRRFETTPAKPTPNPFFRWHATAFRKYRGHRVPTPANPWDCRASPAARL